MCRKVTWEAKGSNINGTLFPVRFTESIISLSETSGDLHEVLTDFNESLNVDPKVFENKAYFSK